MSISYLKDPFYPGQYIDALIDVTSNPVDIDDDDDCHHFQENIASLIHGISDSVLGLAIDGKHDQITEELESLKKTLSSLIQQLVVELVLLDNNDEEDHKEIETRKFILDIVKGLDHDIISSIFHEYRAQGLDISLLPPFKVYRSPKLTTTGKDLTSKQKIMLLESIGVFDLHAMQSLTIEKRGKLISQLLGTNEKNTTEYIRNLNVPKNKVSMDKYFVKTESNLQRVKEISKELGLHNL